MKKTLFFLFFSCSLLLSAQVTNEGTPKSWELNQQTIAPITMPSFNLKAMQAEDEVNDQRKDRPWRFGKEFIVNYDMSNAGEWIDLDNGDRIWRIRFQSKNAITMNFLFEDYYVPRGASVYLYNNDKSDLLGSYTHAENNEEHILGTWLVDGDDVWIEYYEPAKVAGQGNLMIGKVVHGYRSQSKFTIEKALNDSGNCNHDVDCPIDADIEDLKNHNKKGIVLLLNGSSSFCSGSLVNNTTNDGTPYILTANHCYSNPATWSFRFNWISPDPVCATTANSTNGPTDQVMSGAQLRARRTQSDFCLVEINNDIPGDWDVVWNGWDNSDNPPSKTFGIHHPSGDIMKVCVDNDAPYHETVPTAPGEVWWIDEWELGVTEGGSSGSPLFDDNGRIIGQLWGGWAACQGTSNNGLHDYYGRFGISWDAGGSASTQLKDWLDPNDSGVTTLDPYPSLQLLNLDAAASIDNVPDLLCSFQITPVIKVRNVGINTLTSADVVYQLDNQTQVTIEWTGSLETGEEDLVYVSGISIDGEGTFTATIENPNGATDENTANNTASASFALPDMYETNEVYFELIPDDWGAEITWEFVNSAGDVLYDGGPYTNDNTDPINETFTLDVDDCYTFTIFDEYGDGICCDYGNGSYSLETAEGDVIVQGGEYDSSEITSFSNFNVLSTASNSLNEAVTIYPNPTNGILNISNTSGQSLQFEVFNMLGQLVVTGQVGSSLYTIDLSQATTGLYFVKLSDTQGNANITKKVIVK